jgi:hypothetical protein
LPDKKSAQNLTGQPKEMGNVACCDGRLPRRSAAQTARRFGHVLSAIKIDRIQPVAVSMLGTHGPRASSDQEHKTKPDEPQSGLR